MNPTIKRLCVASAAAAAIFVGGTVAAQDNGGEVIHACVGTDGYVRVETEAKPCKRSETPLDWNEQGPQGLPGTPGTNGADGAPATIQPVYGTSASAQVDADALGVELVSTCPAGKYPVGRILNGVPKGATLLADSGGAVTPGSTWKVLISYDAPIGSGVNFVAMMAICI